MLFTLLLAHEGGLLLHASAISEGERGSVFFGPSGSGKTTVARLSAGRTILTDELVIIKPHNGGYRAYGTPFWGEFTPGRSNTRAELMGLYSLKKAGRNYLVPMDRAQAVAELYQCVLFFSDDSNLLGRVLDSCCTLVDAVPVYELHFLPDPSFWQVVGARS
jgi:energy-coupling factor transporter ATP-binding protein EcfA2